MKRGYGKKIDLAIIKGSLIKLTNKIKEIIVHKERSCLDSPERDFLVNYGYWTNRFENYAKYLDIIHLDTIFNQV